MTVEGEAGRSGRARWGLQEGLRRADLIGRGYTEEEKWKEGQKEEMCKGKEHNLNC